MRVPHSSTGRPAEHPASLVADTPLSTSSLPQTQGCDPARHRGTAILGRRRGTNKRGKGLPYMRMVTLGPCVWSGGALMHSGHTRNTAEIVQKILLT